MFKTRRLTLPRSIVVGILGLTMVSPFLSYAYSEPTTDPPEIPDSIPEILNSSVSPQTKTGSLSIGEKNAACSSGTEEECSWLCLNPDTADLARSLWGPEWGSTANVFINNSEDDPTKRKYCITSWSQVGGWFSPGTYLHLFDSSLSAFEPDNGYISLQADRNYSVDDENSLAQQFTFMAEAPGLAGTMSAIRTEGVTDSYYAAQFLGTVTIAGQLCLNDNPSSPSNCISQWSDIAALTDQGIVRIQDLNLPQAKTPDNGSTATSGVLVASNLTIGSPSALTLPVYSAGDGSCQYPQETELNSPEDCHLHDPFFVDPDFSDFYSGAGTRCEGQSVGYYAIPFEITNTSFVIMTASPDVAVVDCNSDSAEACPNFITDLRSTDPRIIDVDPQSAIIQPGGKASFTLRHYNVQEGATADGTYRYRISIPQGNSVTSNQGTLNCRNW